MPAIDRSFDSLSFLSDGLRDMLRRRLREVSGLALIAVALGLGLALASWSVQDPSFSHATNSPVHNLVGQTGAITADLMMQLLGLGAIAIVLPIGIWGWRLASHRPLRREWLRAIFWIAGVLLAALFAACLPRSHGWPLPAGLGGVIGDSLQHGALMLLHGLAGGWGRIAIAAFAGAAAFSALAVTAGFGWQSEAEHEAPETDERVTDADDDEAREPRASALLGWIVHSLLSLKWRLTRWLVHRRSGVVPVSRTAAAARPRRAALRRSRPREPAARP